MIHLINPYEIQEKRETILSLSAYGINHLTQDSALGWNYVLDHVWLTEQISEYVKNSDRVFPVILDVGCGNSLFHNFLEDRLGIKIWGIDRPEGYCHQNVVRNVDFFVDFLDFNYFEPHSVDVIYWLSSIEHNDIETIQHLYRKSLELLRPGGLLLITFPFA